MQYIIGICIIALGIMGLIITTFLYKADEDNIKYKIILYILEIIQIILGILILSGTPILLIYSKI